MATIDLDSHYGFVDRRFGRGLNTGDSILANATEGNYLDQEALDAQLNAADSTTFSAVRLSRMTKNDKIYAYRKIVDNPGMFR